LRGGIVVLDPDSGSVQRVITLQYNPDSLSRGFQLKTSGGDGGARSEAMRFTGPPVQTITVEAELDATDQLEFPASNAETMTSGLAAQLAAIETLIYPTAASVQEASAMMAGGMLEIAPAPAPLVLFAFGRRRMLPVKITELSIVEEAFDPMLNPIRAKVRIGLRVLTVNDVGATGKAGSYAIAAHRQLEQTASRARGGRLSELGVDRV
jgi:hypothetical protein